jgi:hypothetical protein
MAFMKQISPSWGYLGEEERMRLVNLVKVRPGLSNEKRG